MPSMWNDLKTFLFGPTGGARGAYGGLEAEEKLIDYLISLVNREDMIAQEIGRREKVKEIADTGEKKFAYAKLYFQLESFLIANKPFVTKKEFAGKKELRAEIRQHVLVDGLSAPLKLIFSEGNEQAAELYNIALPELVIYTRHSLGEAELASALTAATQGTLLEHAELQDDSLAIEKITVAISTAPLSEVTLAFKKVYTKLLERIAVVLGEKASATVAKGVYDTIANNFNQELLSLFLDIVPGGFLEIQKLSVLSRENLEKQVLEATAALQEEKEQVERKVVERTDELTKANAELQELDKRKSEFLSIAAHQLRTPLSGLKWALNMLIEGDVGEVSNEQKVLLMKSYEGNERLINLVNDMLSANKIERGVLPLQMVSTQLLDLMDNVLYEILPSASRTNISVRFEHRDETLPPLMVDPEKMWSVFQNLLENAIKYSPPGGEVVISLSRMGSGVQIAIADHGIGIPADEQAHVFSRFFRASNAKKMDPNGTGLGLYIVKNIIEMHGGKIRFESSENKGTTFYVTFGM